MGDPNKSLYFSQLKAMLKRNILLKKREKQRTIVEMLLPLYFLSILILIKLLIPDANLPAITTPRGTENLFTYFGNSSNRTIIAAPNTAAVQNFLKEVDITWSRINPDSKLTWITSYNTAEDIQAAYDNDTYSIPIAVIFNSTDPAKETLKYEIRTNPSYVGTPLTFNYNDSYLNCRGPKESTSALQNAARCPVNAYYFSGFLAIQTLIDYTRIRLDTQADQIPELLLEIFPKTAVTADWAVTLRLTIPLYIVIALSQFITYLMILIVGEKEKKIKEGMKIMGLFDSVFWLSWFIVYSFFVLLLSVVCVLLLYVLKIFKHSNFFLVFILILLYGLSIIMFGFMVTPFFDKSRTAGILSTFMLVIMSLLYYVQVYVSQTFPGLVWFLYLLSPAGFAMGIEKVLDMDISGQGITFSNMWSNPGVPFGGSLLMLFGDIILYGLIAYYLDSVIPSEHGVKKSPLFCFKPSFWRSSIAQPSSNRANSENSDDIEPVSTDMHGKEAIQIVDLFKSFKQFRKPPITALNGINLTIYEGQITAILGHNGAGKTTLFNILTGLTAPSSGSAYVFGYDVRNPIDMNKIRGMIGVCPQHDILFDYLTPREHLEFFAAIKGIPNIQSAVEKTIKDIDLVHKVDTATINLSGGQKRKLSIGIAIIGDPKIIILDEPTAGVDPFSRRHMWNLLQNVRHGKVILLTTHFMDEADMLADRKAVVSKGKVRCCGSSLFLKNKFGIGYHLTLVLEENSDEHGISELVKEHVQLANKDRSHGKELSFILPYDAVENFAPLFTAIEHEINNKSKLGISSYGVSMTTLEEVFLSLQKEEAEDDSDVGNGRPVAQGLIAPTEDLSYQELQDTTSTPNHERQDVSAGLRSLESIVCTPNTSQSLSTLIKLRILRLWRDKGKVVALIFMPIIFAALGLYLNNIASVAPPSKIIPLTLSTKLYYKPIGLHNGTSANLDKFKSELSRNVPRIDDFNGNFSSLLDTAPHMAAFDVNSFDDSNYSIAVLYNNTQLHGLPILINMINNAFYGIRSTTNSWSPIEVTTYPFTSTITKGPTAVSSGNYVLGMIFLFSPVMLAIDMVYDREIKARNQLRVNGLSFGLYFISFFIVQVGLLGIITGTLLVLINIFKVASLSSGPAFTILTALVVLYCPSSVLFTTWASYMFDNSDSAQSAMPNMSIVLGVVPYIIITLAKQSAGRILHIIFSFLDNMYIPYGMFYFIQKVDTDCKSDLHCKEPTFSSYMTTEIIVMFVGLLLQIPFWFFMVLIADIKTNGGQIMDIFRSQTAVNNTVEDEEEAIDIGQKEDQDVKNERQRVKTLLRNQNDSPPVVLVENLHKVYVKPIACTRKTEVQVAIKSLSLAVNPGEVFGLLGHNGAGKTTTMKIITAEETATRGRVQIAGRSITSNISSAFQLLGYCPQFDAQWKNITVKEHLEIYASIRGVQKKDIERTVNLYLSGLQIHAHKDKHTEMCSGGTKRKLSYAMAMVGNPKMVLLDEPSTGMDPKSKRFLWDTVLASFKGSKGAILTTHSMEEADALCSRVGIMVSGELRCLGSTQHLKNLYGAGYNLEIKLSVGDSSDATDKVRDLNSFVVTLFPHAILEENFADRLKFSVPQQNVPSLASCFKSLEEAKSKLNIEEYSFSQTTLEQVFLKFAHEGEPEDD